MKSLAESTKNLEKMWYDVDSKKDIFLVGGLKQGGRMSAYRTSAERVHQVTRIFCRPHAHMSVSD